MLLKVSCYMALDDHTVVACEFVEMHESYSKHLATWNYTVMQSVGVLR